MEAMGSLNVASQILTDIYIIALTIRPLPSSL